MRLEDIGFYTLSDARARNASATSPLWRCELILTDKCNFRCPYCRHIADEHRGTLTLNEAKAIINIWADEELQNVRFTGGEPVYWRGLPELVRHAKNLGVKRVAISTNGSADFSRYEELINAGVSDFSISLDACCSETGDKMAGGIGQPGVWQKLTDNIRNIAKETYVTVGVVLTRDNIAELFRIIEFASDDLGVDDIRIISAAQWNHPLYAVYNLPTRFLARHPILRYRINNLSSGRGVRGIKPGDSHSCSLVLDDMAVLNGYHFPCIIYLRERGQPIGRLGAKVRAERLAWYEQHDTQADPICQYNCLDVCVDYNNRASELQQM